MMERLLGQSRGSVIESSGKTATRVLDISDDMHINEAFAPASRACAEPSTLALDQKPTAELELYPKKNKKKKNKRKKQTLPFVIK